MSEARERGGPAEGAEGEGAVELRAHQEALSEARERGGPAEGAEGEGAEGGTSLGRDAWRRLRGNPMAIVGALLILLFVGVAAFAPWLAPYGVTETAGQVTPTTIPGPSSEHWLGLDNLGRDELSRVIYGARQSLIIGVVSLTMGMVAGILLGVIAGGLGGWVDAVV
ncbi:MAG: ABC transporter permease, partial [Nocardioides sp.]